MTSIMPTRKQMDDAFKCKVCGAKWNLTHYTPRGKSFLESIVVCRPCKEKKLHLKIKP